jgi:hypothetical protein
MNKFKLSFNGKDVGPFARLRNCLIITILIMILSVNNRSA